MPRTTKRTRVMYVRPDQYGRVLHDCCPSHYPHTHLSIFYFIHPPGERCPPAHLLICANSFPPVLPSVLLFCHHGPVRSVFPYSCVPVLQPFQASALQSHSVSPSWSYLRVMRLLHPCITSSHAHVTRISALPVRARLHVTS